jgi:hypothetical protein
MLTKHFFTFRKIVDLRPQPLYVDVIVELPPSVSITIARQIAEQEMKEWREGYQLVRDKMGKQRASHFPIVDYRFVGRN